MVAGRAGHWRNDDRVRGIAITSPPWTVVGPDGHVVEVIDRSRRKGDEGEQIWTEWAILAYNADTLAVRER
ncbi:MAG: hypothetical protein JO181_00065 [Solirubrobacterales bacterium]|nr:hypothetical protein [Solirubrobacterales bacterium]